VPTTIGRYVVEGLVGVGAMGRIYKAHDPVIRRTVAIKLISTKLMSSTERSDYIRRFQREAEAAARCEHRNIVTIYDFALHDGEPYLAMEFVYGISLRQALDEQPVMPVAEAIGIMLQVLDALESMHAKGVIHHDIKPANIMLTAKMQVKVGDFGVSRFTNVETTTTFATAGTPAYMSPEQCRGEHVDGRSDLFAAGTTLFEMIAGQRAFSGRNVTELSHRIQNDRLPALPPELRAAAPRLQLVLERATGKQPEDRFDNAAEMAGALRQVLAGLGDDSTRVKPSQPPASAEKHPPTAPVSSQSRPPVESAGPAIDPAVLHTLEDKLRNLVGPIAPVLVRQAARRMLSPDKLCSELALAIGDDAERERFRREAESLLRLRRAAAPGTASLVGSSSASPRLPEEELLRAQAVLTEYVGPIARVLVRQAANRASTVEALWQSLALHVESPQERAAFLRRQQQ
jgi:serine/threonine-protein kinase